MDVTLSNLRHYTVPFTRCTGCNVRVHPTSAGPVPVVGEYYWIPRRNWQPHLYMYKCVSVTAFSLCGCAQGSTYWQATFVAAKASAGRRRRSTVIIPD